MMYHVCSGITEKGNEFFLIKSITVVDSLGFNPCKRYIKCHILCFSLYEVTNTVANISKHYNPTDLKETYDMLVKETTFKPYHDREII